MANNKSAGNFREIDFGVLIDSSEIQNYTAALYLPKQRLAGLSPFQIQRLKPFPLARLGGVAQGNLSVRLYRL